MEDPETPAETGTATDDAMETTETENDGADTTPAEAENTEGDAGEGSEGGETAAAEGPVPYARFHKVVKQRNETTERLRELEAENAQLKAATAPKVEKADDPRATLTGKLGPAPKGLTEMEAVEWYVRKGLELHLGPLLEQQFGMAPQAVAANVTQLAATTNEQIVAKYNEVAKSRGLDPSNRAIRHAVAAAMDSGEYRDFDAALNAIFGPRAVTKPNKAVNGKTAGVGAESDGVVAAALTSAKGLPRNAAEAGRLAAAGKRVPHVSVTDIFAGFEKS